MAMRRRLYPGVGPLNPGPAGQAEVVAGNAAFRSENSLTATFDPKQPVARSAAVPFEIAHLLP